MKIKVIDKPLAQVLALKPAPHKKPKRPGVFFRTLMKLVAAPDLAATHFKAERIGMEGVSPKEPCFFLMNHSSFIDLEIVASLLYPRPFNIVATTDGFVGKPWLMRAIGCIPTRKFVTDVALVRDMHMIPANTIGEALGIAKSILKNDAPSIVAIPDGIAVMVVDN